MAIQYVDDDYISHYNPDSWDGKGTSVVLQPGVKANSVFLGDKKLQKHGGLDKGREVWTLYNERGVGGPLRLDHGGKDTYTNQFEAGKGGDDDKDYSHLEGGLDLKFPGANYPGYPGEFDFQKIYMDQIADGGKAFEALKQISADSELRRIHAARLAAYMDPPENWVEMVEWAAQQKMQQAASGLPEQVTFQQNPALGEFAKALQNPQSMSSTGNSMFNPGTSNPGTGGNS